MGRVEIGIETGSGEPKDYRTLYSDCDVLGYRTISVVSKSCLVTGKNFFTKNSSWRVTEVTRLDSSSVILQGLNLSICDCIRLQF